MKEVSSASAANILTAISSIATSAATIISNYGDSDYLIAKNEDITGKINSMFHAHRSYHIQDVAEMSYNQKQFIRDSRKYTLPNIPHEFTNLVDEILDYGLEYESQQRKLAELKTRLESAHAEIKQKTNALSTMEEELDSTKNHVGELTDESEDLRTKLTETEGYRDAYKHEANELTAELEREKKEHEELKTAYAQLQKNYADIAPTSDAQFGHHPGGSTSLNDLKI